MTCELCNQDHPKDQACSMRAIQEWRAIKDKLRKEAPKEAPKVFDRSKFMKERHARTRLDSGK